MSYSNPDSTEYGLTFKSFLAVCLMEFDYDGVHYSFHGKKLESAVERLTREGGPVPAKGKQGAAELVVWGQAVRDWAAPAESERGGT